jgi:hypothetical protein
MSEPAMRAEYDRYARASGWALKWADLAEWQRTEHKAQMLGFLLHTSRNHPIPWFALDTNYRKKMQAEAMQRLADEVTS